MGVEPSGLRLLGTAPGDYGGRPTFNLLYGATLEGEPHARDDVAEVAWWPLLDLPPLAWGHEAACLHALATAPAELP